MSTCTTKKFKVQQMDALQVAFQIFAGTPSQHIKSGNRILSQAKAMNCTAVAAIPMQISHVHHTWEWNVPRSVNGSFQAIDFHYRLQTFILWMVSPNRKGYPKYAADPSCVTHLP